MTDGTQNRSLAERMRVIVDAPTEDLRELLKIAGLDPATQLRFQEWSGSSFRGCDLKGFDFTGARLLSCDFQDALIAGARFELAEIDRVGFDAEQRTNLRAAKDWSAFAKKWKKPTVPLADRHLHVGAVFQDAPFGPEMVVVPPGSFVMGSPENEPERNANEGPQHEVTIAYPLAVGRYAVTVGEYLRSVSEGGCPAPEWQEKGSQYNVKTGSDDHYKKLGSALTNDDHPIVGVSWDNAKAYAKWLSQKTGKLYRLLSEAEWEYVARAGTTTRYSFGDDDGVLGDYAWYAKNSDGKTHPVGEKKPNPWGLHDVHGNVWEWCEDVWHESYDGAPDDGSAWNDDRSSSRVLRGGSWYYDPRWLRSAGRFGSTAVSRGGDGGFRLARTLTS